MYTKDHREKQNLIVFFYILSCVILCVHSATLCVSSLFVTRTQALRRKH